MGADFVHNEGLDGFSTARGNPRGTMTYTGSGTTPFANFLLGQPANRVTFIAQTRPDMDVTNWEHGYFFQDDWKIKPNLTVNLGVRYELVTPWVDKHDILLNFDPTFDNNTGRFIVPLKKLLRSWIQEFPRFFLSLLQHSQGLGLAGAWFRQIRTTLLPALELLGHWRQKRYTRRLWALLPNIGCAGNSRSNFNQRIQSSFDQAERGVNPPLQAWPNPLTGAMLWPIPV